MQRLILVRHGPTHAKGMIGWTDLPADLSDTAALERLSNWLPKDARVVSSDLIRARDTADAITAQRPRLPHDPAVREMHFGAWEGLQWKDLSPEDQARSRTYYEQPGEIAPPGGESWTHFKARVDPAIDAHLATGGDLVVVCHFGVILSQVQRATGETAYETFARKIDNLSASTITIDAGKWQLEQINHLP